MSRHYVQYESLNRYVLRRLRNVVTVSDDRMSTGRLFHASGPATANARLPNLTRVLGTRRSPLAADQSGHRVDMVATGVHIQRCRMVRGRVWPYTPADTTWMLFAIVTSIQQTFIDTSWHEVTLNFAELQKHILFSTTIAFLMSLHYRWCALTGLFTTWYYYLDIKW